MNICIDAGHNYSSYDTGASGNGLKEQDVTFKIAKELKNLLENIGINVVMTRNNLADNVGKTAKESINMRANIANNAKCDYFISIHCNAGGGTGTETLIYGTGGKAEKLAKHVNDKIVKRFGLKNRGVKVRTDLGVLRLTNMPAILVEAAFIDNQSDANLLKHNINEFAQAIYDGITEYLDVKTEEVDMSVQQAIEILKSKAGLEDQTINFLLCYKYGEALVVKLAEAMK